MRWFYAGPSIGLLSEKDYGASGTVYHWFFDDRMKMPAEIAALMVTEAAALLMAPPVGG